MLDVEKVYRSAVAKPRFTQSSSQRESPRRPKSHHPHLTCYSPLKVRDSIPSMLPLPPIAVQQSREREYVLDAIKSDVFFNSPYHRPRRQSIIRPYDALNDRHSAGYFRSPMVKETVSRTVSVQEKRRIPPEKRGLHRMSARSRSIPTPPAEVVEYKEKSFVLDNVRSERQRNKRNPIIPEYNATKDKHSSRYFRRRLVQNVLRKTTAQPLRLYPTITFFAPAKNDIVV